MKVSLAYTADSVWRNRAEFITGREAIIALLTSQNGRMSLITVSIKEPRPIKKIVSR